MVQLKVVSGKQAGTVVEVRKFPFVLGRNSAANLRLEEEGIWERHLELNLQMPGGFVLKVRDEARAAVNDQPVREATLRNGDLIALGPATVRFWLSETRQTSLFPRECLTWAALAALCAAQIALIYWLLRS